MEIIQIVALVAYLALVEWNHHRDLTEIETYLQGGPR